MYPNVKIYTVYYVEIYTVHYVKIYTVYDVEIYTVKVKSEFSVLQVRGLTMQRAILFVWDKRVWSFVKLTSSVGQST